MTQEYVVWVMENWQRPYRVQADSPEQARALVDKHQKHPDDAPEELALSMGDPDYVDDQPVESWEVYLGDKYCELKGG